MEGDEDLFPSASSEDILKRTREYPSKILEEIRTKLAIPLNELPPQEASGVKVCLRKNVKALKGAIEKWIASYDNERGR